jgi:hypothetical protein
VPAGTFTVALAQSAARRIDRLAEHLASAGPDETRQILGDVLDAEDGVLGRVVTLLAVASYRAQHHNDPHAAAVYAQIANDLHDLVLRLDADLNPAPALPAGASSPTTTPAPVRRAR